MIAVHFIFIVMTTKIAIQTLNKIAEVGTQQFDANKYSVSDNQENPDAILVRSANMHEMELGSNLLAVARAGAGVNNIPIDKCTEKGIVVFNTPGANANAVKELVIGGLFVASRNLPSAQEWVQTLNGKDDEIPKLVEKGKSQFVGPEIMGKTLGVIGLGAIGCMVANTAIKLGMDVVGYDPFLNAFTALRLNPKIVVVNNLAALYKASDYITIHVPYNKDTANTINKETIGQMKDGVIILNYARGELVNDDDIIEALATGKVAKYLTDFPNKKVLGVKNIIATPHIGASTPESEDNCAKMAAKELIDYIENGNVKYSVNLPDAEMSAVDTRICIIHKNIPSLLSKVTKILGKALINIENLVNKSKGAIAYSMIEVDKIDDEVIAKLNATEDVYKVRVIPKKV